MRLYVSASLTAMTMLTCSRVWGFEITAITIRCWGGDYAIYNDRECISATRTEDAEFGTGGHIVCLCPTDHTKLKSFTCSTYTGNVGQRLYRWSTSECYSCGAGSFNNGGSCTNCRDATHNQKATSDVGAASINECYIPENTQGSDSTGEFLYANNCYYDGPAYGPIEDSSKGASWSEDSESTTTTAT